MKVETLRKIARPPTDPKEFSPDQIQTLRDIASAYRDLLEYRRATSLIFMKAWRAGCLQQLWDLMRAEYPHLANQHLHYFVRARGLGDIKIGKTNHIISRVSSILTGCSRGADLVACYAADISHELELHANYHGFRLYGEWFEENAELVAYLEFLGADARNLTNRPPKPHSRLSKDVLVLEGRNG